MSCKLWCEQKSPLFFSLVTSLVRQNGAPRKNLSKQGEAHHLMPSRGVFLFFRFGSENHQDMVFIERRGAVCQWTQELIFKAELKGLAGVRCKAMATVGACRVVTLAKPLGVLLGRVCTGQQDGSKGWPLCEALPIETEPKVV